MTTTLTPTQQADVDRARQFLRQNQTPAPVTLIVARGLIADLLLVIDDLTGDPPPIHTGEGITGMYWDNLGHGGAS